MSGVSDSAGVKNCMRGSGWSSILVKELWYGFRGKSIGKVKLKEIFDAK